MPKRLLLLTALIAAFAALVPATASAAECWKELVNDYWADNRVDRTYPISCYREAMESLPADVQQYSDAQDDLRRALLAAIREGRDSGGGFSGGDGSVAPGRGALPPGPDADDGASKGFFREVISTIGPKNADSIPVPLLVLGSIALLLVGAAGVSYLTRYLQARRNPPGSPV
jgi:hypothetical protein